MEGLSSPPIKTLSGYLRFSIALPSARNSGLEITEKVLFSSASESSDVEMISMYQRWLRDTTRSKNDEPKLSRKMGYISTVNDAKDILEKLYKSKESKG